MPLGSGLRVFRKPFAAPIVPAVMQCIYNGSAVLDWDANNLRKIRAHRIKAEEVEKALSNDMKR